MSGSNWKDKGLKARKDRLNVEVLVDEEFSTDAQKYPDGWTIKLVEAMEAELDNIHNFEDFDKTLRKIAEDILPKRDAQKLWNETDKGKVEAALIRRRKAIQKAAGEEGLAEVLR